MYSTLRKLNVPTKTAKKKDLWRQTSSDIYTAQHGRDKGGSPTMTKSRGWRSLRYRLLALAALVICLTSLLASATSPQSTCCQRCLERFQQCDSPDFICCQIYAGCIQQCAGGCPSCAEIQSSSNRKPATEKATSRSF